MIAQNLDMKKRFILNLEKNFISFYIDISASSYLRYIPCDAGDNDDTVVGVDVGVGSISDSFSILDVGTGSVLTTDESPVICSSVE